MDATLLIPAILLGLVILGMIWGFTWISKKISGIGAPK